MEVGIVGCGFVGLVTGACLAEIGHVVRCVERDPARILPIREGRAPFYEAGLDEILARRVPDGTLRVDTEIDVLSHCDIIFLTVGTPTVDGAIDLSQIKEASRLIGASILARAMNDYPVVVVKSTVVPGTTEGPVRTALEEGSGLVAGRDFGLAMNPEFLREGEAVADFREPDRIVLGCDDDRALEKLRALYEPYDCPVLEMSPINAEMCKYANNTLLATLISFANDLGALCEDMPGADIRDVNRAMFLDRRMAPMVDGRRIEPGVLTYLRAGIGFGGSCFPKDVAALARVARDRGRPSAILEATLDVNKRRPMDVVRRAEQTLGDLDGRRIALLGLAFKPGTDDTRESVSLAIADELVRKGANVVAYDPFVTSLSGSLAESISFAPDLATALNGAEATLIATAWPEFAEAPWEHMLTTMARPIVLDGRGQLRDRTWPDGTCYLSIGIGPAPR